MIHQCLTDEQLLDLASGRCAEEAATALLAQVEGCRDCELLLAEAGRAVADVEGDEHEPSPLSKSDDTFSVHDYVAGRYRIERIIGRGGMGEVYEAVDTELGERLALKTIRAKLAERDVSLERFKREIRLARRVVHPNVCRVLEFGRHDDDPSRPTYFLTMELLDGELLSTRLRRTGPFMASEALNVAQQISAGLQVIHAEGILHRDIKTNNIMFCFKDAAVGEAQLERAVLLDFGVARSVEAGQTSLTADGLIGTPDYMAPEQLEGGELSPATDVYAVGLVMFELLTGRLPSQAENSLARAVNRLQAPAPRPSKFVPTLNSAVDDLVSWCLALKPSDRPASAAELSRAIAALGNGAWRAPASVREPTLRPVRRRGRRALTLVLATAVLGAALGFMLRSSKTAQSVEPQARPKPELTQQVGPQQVGLQQVGSQQVGSQQVGSQQVGSQQAAAAQAFEPDPQAEPGPGAKRLRSPESKPKLKPKKATLDCSTPYYYDRDGIQVFRKECL